MGTLTSLLSIKLCDDFSCHSEGNPGFFLAPVVILNLSHLLSWAWLTHLLAIPIMCQQADALGFVLSFYLPAALFQQMPHGSVSFRPLSETPLLSTDYSMRSPRSGVYRDHYISESGPTLLSLPSTLLDVSSSAYHLALCSTFTYLLPASNIRL